MKNLKLYYSVILFMLTTIMIVFFPMCTETEQYVLIGLLMTMGYVTSIFAFTWWKDGYFSQRDYDDGYRSGWAECKKYWDMEKHDDVYKRHIQTFKNLEGYSYDGEEEIL